MTRLFGRSITLAVGILAVACAKPAAEPAPAAPPAITQANMEKSVADQVAALNAGDAAKVGTSYTTDAVFVSARGKVETQGRITGFWTEALKNGAGKDLKLNIVKWGTSGDMAYTLSTFSGGITAPSGHVLAVTQRQADGTMKIVAQISIPDATKK